jgi:hypothetical protein
MDRRLGREGRIKKLARVAVWKVLGSLMEVVLIETWRYKTEALLEVKEEIGALEEMALLLWPAKIG